MTERPTQPHGIPGGAQEPAGQKEQEHAATRPAQQTEGAHAQATAASHQLPGAAGEQRTAPTEKIAAIGQPYAPEAPPARKSGARGTAAMDPKTRQEVARKGGLAVSRNRQHMAEIGRKGGQSVSKNREHMAAIGRKGGEASRGRG
jgi:hypothetical protein